MSDNNFLRTFLKTCADERRQVVHQIVNAVQKADTSLCMAIKWNQLTFAKDNDFHHWICGIRLLKSSINLYYHFGGLLDDPSNKLSSGSSKFGRWIAFCTEKDIDIKVIEDFTKKAIEKLPFFKAHWKEIQAGAIAEKSN
jgi:hypothetical protein